MSYLIAVGKKPRIDEIRPGIWVVRPGGSAFLLRELSAEEANGKARITPARAKTQAVFTEMAVNEEMDFLAGRYRVTVAGTAWKRAAFVTRLVWVVCNPHGVHNDPAIAVGRWARFRAWCSDTFWSGSRAAQKDASKKSPRP